MPKKELLFVWIARLELTPQTPKVRMLPLNTISRIRASSRVRTCDLLITRELHYHCAIEAFCSRYEDRTRVDRLKICNPYRLDEPTNREFDRIRTCVDKCHKLAPKPLGHKLHITCFRWTRTTTSRTEIWYATITPWSSISSPQKESNLR